IVGLNKNELEIIASNSDVEKCSRRDLPFVVGQKKHAATTVAATMIIAHAAGIKVFATGGIGGVHRGVEEHGDVSADLMELKQTPVAVISAGIKSILDIPRTLEKLESYGVPVCTYKGDQFPAFFTRESGVPSPRVIDSMEMLSEVTKAHFKLGMETGFLIANPIAKVNELDPILAEQTIAKATDMAREKGVKGKDITPFLLAEVNAISKGKSLASNVHLIKANASLAAKLAVKLV
ncbi:MAG: pseudouridine-5'-phosphate glycosidase, partial [Flavobacteriales bacterium]